MVLVNLFKQAWPIHIVTLSLCFNPPWFLQIFDGFWKDDKSQKQSLRIHILYKIYLHASKYGHEVLVGCYDEVVTVSKNDSMHHCGGKEYQCEPKWF